MLKSLMEVNAISSFLQNPRKKLTGQLGVSRRLNPGKRKREASDFPTALLSPRGVNGNLGYINYKIAFQRWSLRTLINCHSITDVEQIYCGWNGVEFLMK